MLARQVLSTELHSWSSFSLNNALFWLPRATSVEVHCPMSQNPSIELQELGEPGYTAQKGCNKQHVHGKPVQGDISLQGQQDLFTGQKVISGPFKKEAVCERSDLRVAKSDWLSSLPPLCEGGQLVWRGLLRYQGLKLLRLQACVVCAESQQLRDLPNEQG